MLGKMSRCFTHRAANLIVAEPVKRFAFETIAARLEQKCPFAVSAVANRGLELLHLVDAEELRIGSWKTTHYELWY